MVKLQYLISTISVPPFEKQPFVVVLQSKGSPVHTFFFYKNIVYKNIQPQIGQKIKNILRISSASVLAIVFCFFVFFSKIFLINRTLLI